MGAHEAHWAPPTPPGPMGPSGFFWQPRPPVPAAKKTWGRHMGPGGVGGAQWATWAPIFIKIYKNTY